MAGRTGLTDTGNKAWERLGSWRRSHRTTYPSASSTSERVFWSFWRPGDTLPEFLVSRFAYCLLGWNFLVLVRSFRVASFAPLFLCGAVNGRVAAGFEYRRMARSWSNRRNAR